MSDPMSERYKLDSEELAKLRDSERGPAPPLDTVAPISADDLSCFEEIKAVLERHGKIDRFGITLLHSHFHMSGQEILLEKSNTASRTMVLEPAIIDSSDISLIDTQWYLGASVPLSLVKCRTNWHS